MTTIYKTIIFLSLLFVFGCSEKETGSNPIDNSPTKFEPYFYEGEILVEFIDTLSQANAEKFLHSVGLNVFTLYNFDKEPPHSSIIEVPVGDEDVWIDSLRKYKEIKLAGRIGSIPASN